MSDHRQAALEFGHITLSSNGTNARTLTVQVRGNGSEGADDDAEPFDGAEVLQPLGLITRPALTPTTEALYVRVGDEILVIGVADKGANPFSDLEEGETRLYGAGNDASRVRLRKDGTTQVESDTTAEKNVVLNGGTLKVARVSDPVVIGTLSGVVAGGAVNFVFTPANADGIPGSPPSAQPTVTLTAVIANAGGATFVKA